MTLVIVEKFGTQETQSQTLPRGVHQSKLCSKMKFSRWNIGILGLIAATAVWAGLSEKFSPSEAFMPHAHCYLFNQPLIWLHGGSDLAIGLAYVAISATLVYLVRRTRKQIPFHWMMLAFAAFILACGATHLMELWTLEALHPRYWLAGQVKVVCAIASVTTAILLPGLVPKVVGLVKEAGLSRERKSQLEDARIAAEQQTRVDEAVRKKEVLLRREIHHRVKNNLQVISSLLYLQSLRVKDDKTLEMLRETQTRARSIALIHEKLYQTEGMASMDFGGYIRKLGEDLFHAYKVNHERIALRTGGDGIVLDLDTSMPCGLIVTELISNALKSGFPEDRKGEIVIDLQRFDQVDLRLTVTDTGVGLPADFDFEKGDTLGLKLVHDLTRQIGGKLEFQSNHGTSVTVTFPDPHASDLAEELIF
jgi:two-component sensor histidine kinase